MSIFDRALDRAARFIDDVLLLPDDVRERLERAEAALEAGRFRDAEAMFRGVLGERPGLVRGLVGAARSFEALGRVAEARAAVAEARQQEPDDTRLALMAARLALAMSDVGAAVTAAREAARRLASAGGAPFAEACMLRARAEWMRGRPDRAAREIRKAIAARPDDLEARVTLVEALVDAGARPAASRAARGLVDERLDERAAARLGLALHRAGASAVAAPLLERAARAGDTRALDALARGALAAGALGDAEMHARTAIARGGGGAALTLLADVLSAEGRLLEATHALIAASDSRDGDAELLLRAGRTVPLTEGSELYRTAALLERAIPGSPLADALRAHALIGRGEVDAARMALSSEPVEPREALARIRVALLTAPPREVLALLDQFEASELLRPSRLDMPVAQQLRRDALRRMWRTPPAADASVPGDVDLASAIDHVLAFAEERALPEAVARARALRDELDRPLLLAILGEFNAGKSTLVNAFVGADVAPMGILPTTATLNVLRGGAERRVRVVRKDGTTREGTWEDVKGLLAEAEARGALIDHVEIVFPSELLERVWVLDTPGSNAPNPDHEALANEAMRRADAALWVFDAGQAGKATEGRILANVKASKRTVIAALNKVDRLRPEQLDEVKAVLAREMPEVGPDPVTLSAKKALKARVNGDSDALAASGFPALVERLERDIFSRSRLLKRRACAGRLLELLSDALATEVGVNAEFESRFAALEAAGQRLGTATGPALSAIDAAIDSLEAAQRKAFTDAAAEVLSFVRPRTSRFASHGADPEDRAFLAEIIQNRLEQALESIGAELRASFAEILQGALISTESELILAARIDAAMGPALASFGGFQSGLFAGGALRKFFDEVLPKITLSTQPIAEALGQSRAHPRESLRPDLEEALSGLIRSVESDLLQARERLARDQERLRARTYEPLRALHEVLEELVS